MKQLTLGLAHLIIVLALVACSDAEGQSPPPTTSEPPTAALAATAPITDAASSQTTVVTTVVTTTVTDVSADLPPTIAALLPNADPEHGRELTVQYGCTACHALEEGANVVGPSWYNIGAIAATRVPDESAAFYLYHSIVEPNRFVVEGFLPNLMPQTYQEQLSEQELADVIQYLLTLQQ
jgi:cytochrome c551/c552